MTDLLEQTPAAGLRDFLTLCDSCGVVAHVDKLHALILQTIDYQEQKRELRDIATNQTLKAQWYSSLRSGGEPLWSVYDGEEYLAELWGCWVIYSRKYLRDIRKHDKKLGMSIVDWIGKVERVADLGCGPGWTTAAIKQIWPAARVVGTNITDAKQTTIAEAMADQYGFELHTTPETFHCDLVFASEYFEHFQRPVAHLTEVIERHEPVSLLIANAFNADAIGHFDEYEVGGELLNPSATSRVFNNTLRDFGYRKIQTALWNNRPALWSRE